MSTRIIIENKINYIIRQIVLAQAYKKYSRPEIETNTEVRLIVERILYLIAQATIDLGEAIIAYRKFTKPTDQGDIFQILEEHDIIPRELMTKLIAMTGFRNVLAHGYTKINYDRVYEVLHKDLKDVEEFIELVKTVH